MLDPIETWTSRSLQFQPPITQPAGGLAQPLLSQDPEHDERGDAGHDPGGQAVTQGGQRARVPWVAPEGPASAAGPGRRTTQASAISTALAMIETRPNPMTSDTMLTRWAEPYTLVTTAAPITPGCRQIRHDPADDDPARDEEQERPDQDDGGQRHGARRATAAASSARASTPITRGLGRNPGGRSARSEEASGRSMIATVSTRTILHVDLDAFFAAVEQRDRPELRGRPVIVGGGGPNQRGVVSAASYEARKFGVHSAMPLRTAGAALPAGRVPARGRAPLPAGEPRRHGDPPPVHPAGPADLDRRGVPRRDRVARPVRGRAGRSRGGSRTRSSSEVRLTASVGVAATKLVAKIASDLRKPDGLVVVPPGEEASFLAPLPISRLWGVGEKTAAALLDFGVRTIGDLAALDPGVLERRFGKHGASLVGRAHGHRPGPGGDGGAGEVDRARAHVRRRHGRPGGDRAHAAGHGRRRGLASPRGRPAARSTITLKLRDSNFTTITRQVTPRGAGRPDRADLRGRPDAACAASSTASGSGWWASLRRTSANRDQLALFGGRGPETPPGRRGTGQDPAQVRRPGRDARAASCGRRSRRPSSGIR